MILKTLNDQSDHLRGNMQIKPDKYGLENADVVK